MHRSERPSPAGPAPGGTPIGSHPGAPAGTPGEDEYRLHRRFDRIGRLVGDDGMAALLSSSATVVGLGGVGSHAAEALARSGVRRLVLVDFDRVCITNTNRQLQALQGEVGRPKAEVLAERLRRVNPQADVEAVPAFYAAGSADRVLGTDPGIVVDAIDNVTAKCHLLAECRGRGIPVVCCTGASGRIDPTQVRVGDLADSQMDPLAATVRRVLRTGYGFPREGPFGIQAAWSEERPREPLDLHYDGGAGFRCVCPGGTNDLHSCEARRVIYGTAGFVTAAVGHAAASLVVRMIVGELPTAAPSLSSSGGP